MPRVASARRRPSSIHPAIGSGSAPALISNFVACSLDLEQQGTLADGYERPEGYEPSACIWQQCRSQFTSETRSACQRSASTSLMLTLMLVLRDGRMADRYRTQDGWSGRGRCDRCDDIWQELFDNAEIIQQLVVRVEIVDKVQLLCVGQGSRIDLV